MIRYWSDAIASDGTMIWKNGDAVFWDCHMIAYDLCGLLALAEEYFRPTTCEWKYGRFELSMAWMTECGKVRTTLKEGREVCEYCGREIAVR